MSSAGQEGVPGFSVDVDHNPYLPEGSGTVDAIVSITVGSDTAVDAAPTERVEAIIRAFVPAQAAQRVVLEQHDPVVHRRRRAEPLPARRAVGQRESGGSEVAEARRRQRGLAAQAGMAADLRFEPEGLRCALRLPPAR